MEQQVDEEITFRIPVEGNQFNQQSDMLEQTIIEEINVVVPGVGNQQNSDPNVSMDARTANLPIQQAAVPNIQIPDGEGVTSMNNGRLTIRPEKFDGTGDWEEYQIHFLTCAQLGKWNDSTKAYMLAVSLGGIARRFYAGLPTSDRESYVKIETAFANRFGLHRHREQFKAKLSMYKRKTGESASALGDEIWRLTLRAYADFDLRMQEQLALDAFKNALSLDMKVRCIDKGCKTIEEAVNTVEHYEALFSAERERKGQVRAIGTVVESGSSGGCVALEKAVHELTSAFNKMAACQGWNPTHPHRQPGSKERSGDIPTNNKVICYGCNQEGHYKRNCPRNMGQNHPSRNQQNYSSKNGHLSAQ